MKSKIENLLWKLAFSTKKLLLGNQVSVRVMGKKAKLLLNNSLRWKRLSDFEKTTDKKVLTEVIKVVDEKKVFWDVGANVGIFSIFACKAGSKVFAFEPNPDNVDEMKVNLQINRVEAEILNVALGRENAKEIYNYNKKLRFGGKSNHNENKPSKYVISKVKAKNIIKKAEKPDVVKIDVNGGELEVIKGMKEILHESEFIFVNLYDRSNPDKVHRIMMERGASRERIDSWSGGEYVKYSM